MGRLQAIGELIGQMPHILKAQNKRVAERCRRKEGTMKKAHDIRINRNLLHPWLDFRLGLLLEEAAKKGIYLIITEGYRTKKRQDALYAQGRTKPGKIVTNAKGSTYSSQHMWGVAFDVAINDSKRLYDKALLKKVAKVAKKIGLGWGGDWKSFPDTPHFYLNKWGGTTSKLKKTYGTPTKFKKTWTKKVQRKKGLLLWKDRKKKGSYLRIPNGAKVKVMYVSKEWYAKVKYKGKVGFLNKKYLK